MLQLVEHLDAQRRVGRAATGVSLAHVNVLQDLRLDKSGLVVLGHLRTGARAFRPVQTKGVRDACVKIKRMVYQVTTRVRRIVNTKFALNSGGCVTKAMRGRAAFDESRRGQRRWAVRRTFGDVATKCKIHGSIRRRSNTLPFGRPSRQPGGAVSCPSTPPRGRTCRDQRRRAPCTGFRSCRLSCPAVKNKN